MLSSILFNCVVDVAFQRAKARLGDHGLYLGEHIERLTNIRYADDILLFGNSLQELVEMSEIVLDELRQIGLKLNASKTKILRGDVDDGDADVAYIDVSGDLVQILDPQDSHKYLGKMLSTSISLRIEVEFKNRKRQAWACFCKHRKVLVNKNISLKSRLRFFDACVTPTVLFGLHCLPIPQKFANQLDAIQNKMLRAIVGWRRVEGESWRETMERMNERVLVGFTHYYCNAWSMIRARNLWRYAIHVASSSHISFPQKVAHLSQNAIDDPASLYAPHRSRGRPRQRWDDSVAGFCKLHFDANCDWITAMSQHDGNLRAFEDEFIVHAIG